MGTLTGVNELIKLLTTRRVLKTILHKSNKSLNQKEKKTYLQNAQ